jgi:methylmalonic aciduria homocystinuria type C protein
MGVCLHPKYGGWFAMRCVFIFKNVQLKEDDLIQRKPIDVLDGDQNRIMHTLKEFNFNWRNGLYRDSIKLVVEK